MNAPLNKYDDRYQAGKILATHLTSYAKNPHVIILALPRGGVPVAAEMAKALQTPFDIFIVRKLGVPGHEELAMGAIASDNTMGDGSVIFYLFYWKNRADSG